MSVTDRPTTASSQYLNKRSKLVVMDSSMFI